MYAVIKTGGKQYRVAQGDGSASRSSRATSGDTVTLGEVLLVGRATASRSALRWSAAPRSRRRSSRQDRGKKIIIFKFRRRKNYRRKTGHRQPFTALEITGITG